MIHDTDTTLLIIMMRGAYGLKSFTRLWFHWVAPPSGWEKRHQGFPESHLAFRSSDCNWLLHQTAQMLPMILVYHVPALQV